MSDKPSTDLVTAPAKTPMLAGNPVAAIIPKDHVEAGRMGAAIFAAGLAPDSYKSAEQVMIGIMAGLELGVAPMQALSGIAIINRRPAVWGDLAVALCQKGGMTNHEAFYEGTDGEDGYTAVYRAWRGGQKNAYEGRFSVADAKRAKLWMNASKQPWIMYPNRMLMNRARAFALRDGFADCLKGLAIVEEARDFEPPMKGDAVSTDFLSDEAPVKTEPSSVVAIPPTEFLED